MKNLLAFMMICLTMWACNKSEVGTPTSQSTQTQVDTIAVVFLPFIQTPYLPFKNGDSIEVVGSYPVVKGVVWNYCENILNNGLPTEYYQVFIITNNEPASWTGILTGYNNPIDNSEGTIVSSTPL